MDNRWQPRMHHLLRLCIKSNPGHVLNTQLTKTHKMHEALRLCIQIARGHRMGGSRMHQVLRLCIKSSPGHVNYTFDKNTQNARNAAPLGRRMPRTAQDSPREPRGAQDSPGKPRTAQESPLGNQQGFISAGKHDCSTKVLDCNLSAAVY